MKIGVLTYHRIVNTGAVIQAYAVTKILQDIFPNSEIEIIDLFPLTMFYKEHRKSVSLRQIKMNREFIEKQKEVQRLTKFLNLLSHENIFIAEHVAILLANVSNSPLFRYYFITDRTLKALV